MTRSDLVALLPLIITAYSAVILIVVLPFIYVRRSINRAERKWSYGLTVIALLGALCSVFAAVRHIPKQVTPLIRIDGYSVFFSGLIIAGALLVTLISHDYLNIKSIGSNEESHSTSAPKSPTYAFPFYLLLLLAALGMATAAASFHLVSFFLAYEIISISLVGLIGYMREHKRSYEAAIKYLILSATASAFLVLGMAFIYFELGTMEFSRLAAFLELGKFSETIYFGIALLLVGFGYKLALVPFHTWSPDVYQGAPAPVTAIIASGSKVAILALLLRLVSTSNLQSDEILYTLLYVLAVATMFGGNFLALMQDNIKRLLAYSSIAQIGYLLIPLAAGGKSGAESITFYLVSYVVTTVAAFGVVSVVSLAKQTGEIEKIDDYRGLAMSRPVIAAVLSTALLSLLGMPLTSGFFGKFYIFSAAAQSGLWSLLIVGLVNSGISAFYYLRVIFAVYSRPPADSESVFKADTDQLPTTPPASAICLAISTATIVFFGVYPTPLLELARIATAYLGIR
jgi:NADH-quinone oxidoreductase subunit N